MLSVFTVKFTAHPSVQGSLDINMLVKEINAIRWIMGIILKL